MAENTGRHRWSILAVLCISLLIISLDETILNVALPTLVRDLHASTSQLQWVVDAYAVVFAGLLLVLGNVGDRIGRKKILLAGLAVFAGGSAAAAFSGSTDHLIAARALMAVGSAGIMPSTLSILTNVFTDDQSRARAIGLWSGTTGLGIALGPIIGGWLLSRFWWGSVFLVNVPIAVAGIAVGALLIPDSRDDRAGPPDTAGAVLSVAGMGLLLWAIIEAPGRGWGSAPILGTLGAALIVLTAFALWERHTAHPMLDLSLFTNRRFSVAMGAMALTILALMGLLFLLTQYLQFSLGYSALGTGLRVAPVAAVLVVASPLSSMATRWLGSKAVITTGIGAVALGLAGLARTTTAGGYDELLGSLLVIGIGTGLALAPSIDSVMGTVPLDRAGAGSATNSAALQVGGALGVGVLGSLLNGRYTARLDPIVAQHHVPPATASLITGSLGGALAVAHAVGGSLGAGLASVARHAFVSGFDLACLAGAGISLFGAVLVLILLPNRPLASKLSNRPVASDPRPVASDPKPADVPGSPGELQGLVDSLVEEGRLVEEDQAHRPPTSAPA